MQVPYLKTDILPSPHAFFTREGGNSVAPYDSLNGGWNTDDDLNALKKNWAIFSKHMSVLPSHLLSVEQVHGINVIDVKSDMSLWPVSQKPCADALVTARSDVALCVTTADCAPVLFSSDNGRLVGAAHAGWRGAVAGVLEATVDCMRKAGAQRITAVVGPCISASSYEISVEMKREILAYHPQAKCFFDKGNREGHVFFDLPRFCAWRLKCCAVDEYQILDIDTCTDDRFFSYRRACLGGSPHTGRQISSIRAFSSDI